MNPSREIENRPDFTVLGETEDYIVVNKPAPLLVHPSKPENPTTLLDGLRALLAFEMACGGQISIINRLDRETSGTVLAAKNAASARKFHLAMEHRLVKKEYLAIVWGWPEEESFTVDAPILRRGEVEASPVYLMQCIHEAGAPSVTDFRVLHRFEKPTSNGTRFSLIHARPHTGRMHQIRLHLRQAGFGIVGDKLYGHSESCYLEFIETGWTAALKQRLLLPRHALHSSSLEIDTDGEFHKWRAPLADDLVEFMPSHIQELLVTGHS